jgi:hypothetical protein
MGFCCWCAFGGGILAGIAFIGIILETATWADRLADAKVETILKERERKEPGEAL